jgi:Centromere protein H (CENP-H)
VRAAVVRAALVADPVLSAAHHRGEAAAGDTRGLGDALGARDALAMLHGAACAREEDARESAALAEREAAVLWGADAQDGDEEGEDLVGMARRVVRLAGEVAEESVGADGAGEEWEAAEREEKEAKRKWRIMKGLVAGVVVGSGVRWAEDEELVDLVLDDG